MSNSIFLTLIYYLAFTVVFGVGLYLYVRSNYSDKKEAKVLLLILYGAFLVRLAVIFYTIFHTSMIEGSDATLYENFGVEIAKNFRALNFSGMEFSENISYKLINGITFLFFGFQPVIIRILNSFLFIIAATKIYDISKLFKNVVSARISIILLLFWPSLILFTSSNLKESLVILLMAIIMKNLVLMSFDTKLKNIIIPLICSGILFVTRMYIGMISLVIIILILFVVLKIDIKFKIGLLIIVVPLAGAILKLLGFGFMGYKFFQRYNLSTLNQMKNWYHGNSNVFQDIDISTVPRALAFLPLGFLYFMFAPFPWQAKGFFQVMTIPESIIWYVLIILFLVPGINHMIKKLNWKTYVPLMLMGIIITLLYSITIGNIGTSYRMRYQTMLFVIPIVSFGFDNFINKIKLKRRSLVLK